MAYTIIVSKSAQKTLKSLSRKQQLRIIGVIDSLVVNPFPPASAKLKGRDGFRIRTNDYRIIYTVENQKLIVRVIAIGHRKDIYRK
jgi:mRNA interferase RelE/StbE